MNKKYNPTAEYAEYAKSGAANSSFRVFRVFRGSKPVCRPLSRLRPVQMCPQKLKSPHAIDRVRAVEEFDGRAIPNAERVIKPADFGKFISNPFIRRHPVIMPAFDHERSWRDQRGHLRVVECVAEVEFHHFVFAGVEIAVG